VHPFSSRVASILGTLITLGLGAACGSDAAVERKPAAHIAIVIGPAGSKSSTLRPVYEWAIGAINEAGGAGGRRFEARYIELDGALAAAEAQTALAAELIGDPDLVAVAGSFSFAMAPALVAAHIPYITPESGDDDIFRAFHTGGYVWRTVESDSTMLWFLLAEARGRGLKEQQDDTSVALLTGTDSYGQTFFDWYGFHATELGLTAMEPVQYDQDKGSCERPIEQLLAVGTPDYLVAVPGGRDPVAQSACMVRTMKARAPATKVLFADSAHVPAVIEALGADAEGMSGYNTAPDPNGGFPEAFTRKTGFPTAPEHAANALDAMALLAYGLEKAGGQGRAALDAGMRAVVDGRGAAMRWDSFSETLAAIRRGETPDLAGASGPLTFDREVYTDPTATYFDRWVVEHGAFAITHHVTTESEAGPNVHSQAAVARGLKALKGDSLDGTGGTPDLLPLHDNWALVVATSGTWANYRHQADALAQYQALKANGFDDDHIVLVTADDLAGAHENLMPGQIINAADGSDVYAGARADYKGPSLDPTQLMTVLSGGADPALPAVLHSRADDNVYVYLVGHGGPQGPYLGVDERPSVGGDLDHVISPLLLASTVGRMKANGQFRRMLIAVDACHAGVLGPALQAQGVSDVILFAAAAAPENSFSANYSARLGVWTADQFSYRLLEHVRQPALSIHVLYDKLYGDVTASHVQSANADRFGPTATISFSEFVTRRAP
jgi:ABC-type branched-subunit amino acid transport system substrate-binding protein